MSTSIKVDGHRTKPSRAVTHVVATPHETHCGLAFPPPEWYSGMARYPICKNCHRVIFAKAKP